MLGPLVMAIALGISTHIDAVRLSRGAAGGAVGIAMALATGYALGSGDIVPALCALSLCIPASSVVAIAARRPGAFAAVAFAILAVVFFFARPLASVCITVLLRRRGPHTS